MVKQKYGRISSQNGPDTPDGCCGPSGCCDTVDYSVFAEDYRSLKGYNPEADLGLGCGLPTRYAQISKGDTVVDLGSGAGNDCFVAREETGEQGHVIGLDMTPEMVQKARKNAEKLGYENVEFLLGDIEEMPIGDRKADVVVSNCVLNLVPDKKRAFSETYRILRRGGHFSISDIVTRGSLPDGLRNDAEMYAGCVAGAIDLEQYLSIIRDAGFTAVKLQKQKEIKMPDELLEKYLSTDGVQAFRNSKTGIYSITVYGEKPA